MITHKACLLCNVGMGIPGGCTLGRIVLTVTLYQTMFRCILWPYSRLRLEKIPTPIPAKTC